MFSLLTIGAFSALGAILATLAILAFLDARSHRDQW